MEEGKKQYYVRNKFLDVLRTNTDLKRQLKRLLDSKLPLCVANSDKKPLEHCLPQLLAVLEHRPDPLARAAEGHKLLEREIHQQFIQQAAVADVLLERVEEHHAERTGRLDFSF